jgi:hypothetical protein
MSGLTFRDGDPIYPNLMEPVASDGNFYNYLRKTYNVDLSAGFTAFHCDGLVSIKNGPRRIGGVWMLENRPYWRFNPTVVDLDDGDDDDCI